jgi:tripartite-type tricarboxylate transporter receptor subunit TctC
MARVMKKYLPQDINVVVRNIPGAGGRTGHTYIMRAKPDGYTIAILHGIGAFVDHLLFADLIPQSLPILAGLLWSRRLFSWESMPRIAPWLT